MILQVISKLNQTGVKPTKLNDKPVYRVVFIKLDGFDYFIN